MVPPIVLLVALSILPAGAESLLPQVRSSSIAKAVGFVDVLKVSMEDSLKHPPGHQQSWPKLTTERENIAG